MNSRWAVRLALTYLLCAVPTGAGATGEYLQDIRFFSRSGMDQADSLAYFHEAAWHSAPDIQ